MVEVCLSKDPPATAGGADFMPSGQKRHSGVRPPICAILGDEVISTTCGCGLAFSIDIRGDPPATAGGTDLISTLANDFVDRPKSDPV